ncbi:MAG: hypothetical protein FD166_693 [Bacteroidetes bacterium]|nr:MAG: hypothetical protein FD166_693 [Bacteroidota bacterium]
MKKLVLFIALLSVIAAKSQKSVYYPFPDSNACWNIDMSQGMCFLGGWSDEKYSITISGDTAINGQTYHKLFTPFVKFTNNSGYCTQQNFQGYKGAFRQDIPDKKVYFIPPALTAEQLLYDFSMNPGDTVKGYLQQAWDATDIVQEVDSVLVGDSYRKRWLINPCYNIHLIEGVGSTYGLLQPSPGCMTDMAYYEINCFSLDGVSLYPETSPECLLITSISGQKPDIEVVNIYPNPSNGSFNVGVLRPDGIDEVRVTDMVGNLVFQKQIRDQEYFSISGLDRGTYILTIVDKNGRTTSRKIISCP